MEKSRTRVPWISGSLALLIGLLFAAVSIPNFPPRPVPYLWIFAAALLPALCIFTLARRWILFEWLAWIFLSLLLAAIFVR